MPSHFPYLPFPINPARGLEKNLPVGAKIMASPLQIFGRGGDRPNCPRGVGAYDCDLVNARVDDVRR